MRYLATGTPDATFEGDYVVLRIPCGDSVLEIALDPGRQCQLGVCALEKASIEAFDSRTKVGAEIIEFSRHRQAPC